MTIAIPQWCQDGSYPAAHLRVRDNLLWTPGALSPTSLLVALTSGFGVSVQPGAAYVQQTVQSEGNTFYDGLYLCLEDAVDAPYNTITAPLVHPRLDQVILRVYDVVEQGLTGSSFGRIEWLVGAENAGATYPNTVGVGAAALPPNSFQLAWAWQTVGESSIAHLQDARKLASLQPSLSVGPWTPLTLASGVAANGLYVPSVRLQGDVVRFKGSIQNTTGSGIANPLTVPVGMHPSQVVFPAGFSGNTISAAGVSGGILGAGLAWSLDGLTYTLS